MSSQANPTKHELSQKQEQEIREVFEALGLSSDSDRDGFLGIGENDFSFDDSEKDPEFEIVSTSTPYGGEKQDAKLDRAT